MRALALKALGQEPKTPRNFNQGPKISFETSSMITSKLKERLAKSRRGVATKKHFEKVEKPPVPSTILPTLTSLEQINDKYYHQLGDGFSEKICTKISYFSHFKMKTIPFNKKLERESRS